MQLTPTHIFWLGSGIILIFFMMGYLKLHRRKDVLISLFIVGLISLIAGLILTSNPEFEMKKGNAATTFFAQLFTFRHIKY